MTYVLTIKLVIIITAIIITTYLGYVHHLLELSNSQILYAFSASAQVIAGLFGLTIAAYIFFQRRLDDLNNSSETIGTIIDEIRINLYIQIKFISVLGIFSIVLSIALIFLMEEIKDIFLFLLLMNITASIVFMEVVELITFACRLINPKLIEETADQIQKDIISHKSETTKSINSNYSDDEEYIRYGQFMNNFIRIENLLLKYYKDNYAVPDKLDYHVSLQGIVIELKRRGKINDELSTKLIYMIKLRNSLLHGKTTNVSDDIVKECEKLFDDLTTNIGY